MFHSSFTPLEHSIGEHRAKNAAYAKVIIHKADGNRVLGFHILAPNAGEWVQLAAGAVINVIIIIIIIGAPRPLPPTRLALPLPPS